ncbi:unnamed protein product [Phyllotreta striolata]|uniref:E3 ubiquitin-protein ligase RNF144B n=1 Tax=Phyllotreta striolata TaxID=444603 RepID=A0A9N9TW03_PHYSR|nr:unnamed protein product [Phyllotreta striolata]
MTPPARRTSLGDGVAAHPSLSNAGRSFSNAAEATLDNDGRERRRAVYSWSAGYGTLREAAEEAPPSETTAAWRRDACDGFDEDKPADYAALLPHRPVTAPKPLNAAPRGNNNARDPPPATPRPQRKRHERLFALPTSLRAWLGGRRGQDEDEEGEDREAGPRQPLVGGAKSRRNGIGRGTTTGRAGGRGRDKRGAGQHGAVRPASSLDGLRRCETVMTLTGYLRPASSATSLSLVQPSPSNNGGGGTRPTLAPPATNEVTRVRTCSRCSSLLTLASGSRYSLDSATGVFVAVTAAAAAPPALCKLCLLEVGAHQVVRIEECACAFCKECMKTYVEFEIGQGAYDISCPDAQCPSQGVLRLDEIERLAGRGLLDKHKQYRFNREVDLDATRAWCPRPGCETVCQLGAGGGGAAAPRPPKSPPSPHPFRCPACSQTFCAACKGDWHPGAECGAADAASPAPPGIPFDSETIKCCPMCGVPIEKDEGCAQMMCKRCKHVFCWYCLASLDDDFLLRHYDKGPCKNKLGHSRASVIWHRAQVIGIFAGFGVLLLVASPLLLLAAPCIVCCKCRTCGAGVGAAAGVGKLDEEEEDGGVAEVELDNKEAGRSEKREGRDGKEEELVEEVGGVAGGGEEAKERVIVEEESAVVAREVPKVDKIDCDDDSS